MKTVIYDIETTAIERDLQGLVKRIWAVGLKVIDGDTIYPTQVFSAYHTTGTDGSLVHAKKIIQSADVLVGFNSISFDDVVLRTHWNIEIPTSLDLMILAKLMFTKDELFAIDAELQLPKELWGSYSLKAFALRMGGQEKIEFEDWTKLSAEMLTYCKGDVDVTYDFYRFLLHHARYPIPTVATLEMQVKRLVVDQETAGFHFNYIAARELSTEMLTEKFSLERKLTKTFTPRFIADGKPQKTENMIKSKVWLPNADYKSLLGTNYERD